MRDTHSFYICIYVGACMYIFTVSVYVTYFGVEAAFWAKSASGVLLQAHKNTC